MPTGRAALNIPRVIIFSRVSSLLAVFTRLFSRYLYEQALLAIGSLCMTGNSPNRHLGNLSVDLFGDSRNKCANLGTSGNRLSVNTVVSSQMLASSLFRIMFPRAWRIGSSSDSCQPVFSDTSA